MNTSFAAVGKLYGDENQPMRHLYVVVFFLNSCQLPVYTRLMECFVFFLITFCVFQHRCLAPQMTPLLHSVASAEVQSVTPKATCMPLCKDRENRQIRDCRQVTTDSTVY